MALVATPSTAERIRSACARAGGALLAVDGIEPVTPPVRHLLADGSFAVTVPADGPLADCVGAPAVLELTDYAPLPLREPVRALVWIRGSLQPVAPTAVSALLDAIAAEHPNPALLQVRTPRSRPGGPHTPDTPHTPHAPDTPHVLLRLTMESVVVADATGAEPVDVGALLAAAPDPFAAIETCWVRHVQSHHPEVIARLASKLPARLRRGDVRPLGIDRYGVRLRVEAADGDHDVRLAFGAPVDDITGLNRAIRILMGCPFVNGLRAR